MGVSDADRLRFVGIFGALIFVVGAPLVPLWGVWADKYSRKVVIVRSALVEAVVFAGVALSHEPWQLAVSFLLVGFQLGNTGVILAAIRDATPRLRLGTAIALFGASTPVGMAIGPDPRRPDRRRPAPWPAGRLLGVVGPVGRDGPAGDLRFEGGAADGDPRGLAARPWRSARSRAS